MGARKTVWRSVRSEKVSKLLSKSGGTIKHQMSVRPSGRIAGQDILRIEYHGRAFKTVEGHARRVYTENRRRQPHGTE